MISIPTALSRRVLMPLRPLPIVLLPLVGLVFLDGAGRLPGADWPGFRGSSSHDATSSETGLLREWPAEGPPLLWTVTGIGRGGGGVVIQNDTAYLFAKEKKAKKGKPPPDPQKLTGTCLVALNMADGTIRWQYKYSRGGINATPTINGKFVYVRTGGTAACLSAEDGKIIWETDVQKLLAEAHPGWQDKTRYDSWAGSPVIDEKHMYVNVGSPKLSVVALHLKDGSVAWAGTGPPEMEGRGYGSPTLFKHAGKDLLVTTTVIHVLGFDPTTGALLWSHRLQDRPKPHCGIGNVPVYADGLLHVSSKYGGPIAKAFQLADDGSSIKEAWNNPSIHPYQESVTCVDGRLFGNGSLLWEHCDQEVLVDGEPLGERIKLLGKAKFAKTGLSKMVAGRNKEKLNNLDLTCGLICQDLKTGKVLGFRTGLGVGAPYSGPICLAADGMLYVIYSTNFNKLYLIDASPAMTIRGQVSTPIPERDLSKVNWTGYTTPSLSNGRLVVRYDDMMFCYKVDQGPSQK